jgi:hypothetical protein
MTEVIVWPGWLGGIAIGLVVIALYLTTGKLLGASSAYGNFCSYISNVKFFKSSTYRDDWRVWFVLGIPLGSFLAAYTSPGEIVWSFSMGELYEQVIPATLWMRALWLIAGGILIGFGARAAGGCQSGHAISGLAVMNIPSLIAAVGFFIGGTVIVQLLFSIWG